MSIKPRKITELDREQLRERSLATFVRFPVDWPGPGEPPDLGDLTEEQAQAVVTRLAINIATRKGQRDTTATVGGDQRLTRPVAAGATTIELSHEVAPGSLIQVVDGVPETLVLDTRTGTGPWTYTLPPGQQTLYGHADGASFVVR